MKASPTPVRERPILFSAPMVREILAGRKSQTRRVARFTSGGHLKEIGGHRRWHPADPDAAAACPYGQAGDDLWVRETWQPIWATEKRPSHGLERPDGWKIGYPATDGVQEWSDYGRDDELTDRCRPSIHMPRWASRITLRITQVRVQRLQEISEEDALAEGVNPAEHYEVAKYGAVDPQDSNVHAGGECVLADSARDFFAAGWDTINAKRGPWSSNPWVWVVTFERKDGVVA